MECKRCGRIIKEGTPVVFFDEQFYHTDCFEKNKEEKMDAELQAKYPGYPLDLLHRIQGECQLGRLSAPYVVIDTTAEQEVSVHSFDTKEGAIQMIERHGDDAYWTTEYIFVNGKEAKFSITHTTKCEIIDG